MSEELWEKDYKRVMKLREPTRILTSCLNLILWDMETYMPKSGISFRAEQKQYLTKLLHKEMTSNKYKTALTSLVDIDSGQIKTTAMPKRMQASVREMRRDYVKETKLTSSFLEKFAYTTAQAMEAWKEAKTTGSFKKFLPHLTKIVSLCRKKAEMLGYKDHPYDALLDTYEPSMTTQKLDEIFGSLKKRLVPLIEKISNSTDQTKPISGHFSTEKQEKLSKIIIEDLCLQKENYNLAQTAHPFCVPISTKDIRVTTRFDETDLLKSFLAVVHETGHANYENNLSEQDVGSPLCEACSTAIHESQSRFYETFIGHSSPFWHHYHKVLVKMFPDEFANISPKKLYKIVNNVKPSMIRIYADEVTYNMHVILRYEIEKGMLDESINIKDIPEIWNEKMHKYLGIKPTSDSEGALQDVHWSLGEIGYFPSYSLGNLYAGSLFHDFVKTYPNWNQSVENGGFQFIKDYLREKIHKYGREFTPIELIENAIGEKFSSEHYLNYLETKYS